MAKIPDGLSGRLSGKIGPVVGASWRGINYVRARPKRGKTKKPLTVKQQEQHAKFILLQRFQMNMKELIMLGYKKHAVRMTEMNSALSFHMKNAVTGEHPDLQIVYSQILVSRGDLPNVPAATVSSTATGQLAFSWKSNSKTGMAKDTDKAIVVAYCEELSSCVHQVIFSRKEENAILGVPLFSGYTVHTWLSFITANEKDIATSIYVGKVAVN